MKPRQYQVLFGLLVMVAILCVAPEITSMTSLAQSMTNNHCTASNPCVDICGDHVCAPGEMAQMKAQAAQANQGNTTAPTTVTSTVSTPSIGVIVGGVVSYLDVASDGTAVIVRTGHPLSGQPLAIGIAFKDASENFVQHQNYAITVTQDNSIVLSNPAGHTHSGTDSLTTSALSSNNPVDIMVTLNGAGLPGTDPSTWTGVKGEVLSFSKVLDVQATTPAAPETTTAPAENTTVPEFGPVASIVLAISILSVVVFAAKTRVIPRL